MDIKKTAFAVLFDGLNYGITKTNKRSRSLVGFSVWCFFDFLDINRGGRCI